jgi:hypothetical protein
MKTSLKCAAIAALVTAACATTTVSVWKKPDVGELAFSKVAVFAAVDNEAMRRTVEDQIAGSIRMMPAVPAYRLKLKATKEDPAGLRDALTKAGFDGAIVMDVKAVDKEASYSPSAGYFAWGAWPYYDTESFTVDTYVTVQTNVYSVPTGELLVGVTSRTANPNDLRDLVDETMATVRKELHARQLLPNVSSRDVRRLVAGTVLAAAQVPARPGPQAQARGAQRDEGGPNIEPKAEGVLRDMSRYLTSLDSFTVEATSVDEKVTTKGRKVQELTESRLTVKRPADLRVDRRGPNGHSSLAADGTTATLVNTDKNVYATLNAPATVSELVDLLRDRLNVDAPGADFLSADPYATLTDGAVEGRYVGLEPLGGVMAHHLMFTRPDLDWQVWVDAGPNPLPLRYVLTSKDQPGQPEFTLELTGWEPKVTPGPDTFVLTPPPDAEAIDLNKKPTPPPAAPQH